MSYRYLGNKTRLADWITEIIKGHIPSSATIGDLMCGTGSMSEAFAKQGYSVIASDLLKFPTLHAQARLNPILDGDFDPVAKSYKEAIEALNNLKPIKDFFWSEYSDEGLPENGAKPRLYFTGNNAGKIDAIRHQIKEWRSVGVSDKACDLLLHDLLLGVNRVANISGTYGYYRSKFDKSSLKQIELTPSSLSTYPSGKHRIFQGLAEDIARKSQLDACYLDPPYTKRQYGGNYHILETIAQEDTPTPNGDGGLRDWKKEASAFCYKRKAPEALENTLNALTCKYIFLSYSEDGQITIDNLYSILKRYGEVTCHKKELPRYTSNKNTNKKGLVTEYLFVIKKSLNV